VVVEKLSSIAQSVGGQNVVSEHKSPISHPINIMGLAVSSVAHSTALLASSLQPTVTGFSDILTNSSSTSACTDVSSSSSIQQCPVVSRSEMTDAKPSHSCTVVTAMKSVEPVAYASSAIPCSSSCILPELHLESGAVTETAAVPAVSEQSEIIGQSVEEANLMLKDESEVADAVNEERTLSTSPSCHLEATDTLTTFTMHSPADSFMSGCETSATTSGISSATPGSTPTSDVSLVLPNSEPYVTAADMSCLQSNVNDTTGASTLLHIESLNVDNNCQSDIRQLPVEPDVSAGSESVQNVDSAGVNTSCSDEQSVCSIDKHDAAQVTTVNVIPVAASQLNSENSDSTAETLSKDWRSSVTQDLRNHLVNKL